MPDRNHFDLSIVLPTHNRADALLKALIGIERATHCSYEVIVVNGASDNATDGVLMLASSIMGTRLRVVREGRRVGVGAACDKGIRIARGRNVSVLHDDVRPLDGALDRAVAQLDNHDDDRSVVAIFAPPTAGSEVAISREIHGQPYAATHIRGTLIAEYPIARREVFQSLPFDVTFATSAAITDFSLAAWNAGISVKPAIDSALERHLDAPRQLAIASAELARVVHRWELATDAIAFDAARPCTLPRQARRRAA